MKNTAFEQSAFTLDKIMTESDVSDSFQRTMTQVENLTHELNKLLISYETTLEQEGIRHEVETLARWLETYRHGLSAAHKISENSTYWLFNFRNKLKLGVDELQRLQSEGGGTSPNSEQIKEAEEILKVIRRIDEILPDMQYLFCKEEKNRSQHCST